MKLGYVAPTEYMGPPLPPSKPLEIEITGGTEQTWFEANKVWFLPAAFVVVFMLANR